MTYRLARPMSAGLLLFCAVAAPVRAIEVPDVAWTASNSYYTNLTDANGNPLVATALRQRLFDIIKISNGVSYANARTSEVITDRVVVNGVNYMSGVYDRAQLTPSATSTWNREHVWPQSKLGGNSDHDLFGLRPALIASNGDRANYGYGGLPGVTYTGTLAGKTGTFTTTVTDTTAAVVLPRPAGTTNSLFYAGPVDRGDVARSCFYMATRYYKSYTNPNTGSTDPGGLTLKATNDGANPDGEMGDLNSMLHWHYQDLPDNFERRRNQLIYANTENSSVSQGNRNPYVDHPEYVWAVFGDAANDSQIVVNTGASGGASNKSVNFGRVIVGGTAPSLSTSVAISKTGADPTTFSVATSGLATADGTSATVRKNIYNAFDYGSGTKNLAVGLTGVTTATAGLKSGSVTIDNTDLTTQAGVANSGALDGDDNIDLSLTVLDHSNASFAADEDADTLFLNFQAVNFGRTATLNFSLTNLLSASGYAAGLDLDSITATGDTGAFGTDLASFLALTAGTSRDFSATFTPTRRGTFSATYTLGVSDENLSGATSGGALTIVMTGVTNSRNLPEPAVLTLLPIGAMLMKRRRPLVRSPRRGAGL